MCHKFYFSATIMDQKGHKMKLQGVCRVCGLRFKFKKGRNPKPAKAFKAPISYLYQGCDVEHDNKDIHPPHVCDKCRSALWRVQSAITKGKKPTTMLPKKLPEFSPHTGDCSICNYKETGRPVKKNIKSKYRGQVVASLRKQSVQVSTSLAPVADVKCSPPPDVSMQSAPPRAADVTCSPPHDASMQSAPPRAAEVTCSHPLDASMLTAPPRAADVTCSPPPDVSMQSAPPRAADVTCSPPPDVSMQTAPPRAADVTCSPPPDVSMQSAPPRAADVTCYLPLDVSMQPFKPPCTE
ncbi:histone-lysine N-methyltransferase 2D-like isoform X2 [Branchiostoma floridae]|uniref:Histone-lysine N-methyltransferase 2D-like isoform X2 n=1 Tax=Branchiostoma floridae TaxID=7739 RepID=A0A9J7KHZ5_BRAFL|nr:histone-lysine N-methyltransferase 2D-like isoform X2 [Branchiostoma floridae]